MRHVILRDKKKIERFLRRRADLHVYELGDLDDAFFPRSTFFGLEDDLGEIRAVSLLYDGGDPPTLLGLAAGDEQAAIIDLVAAATGDLPARLYAHLTPGLSDGLGPAWRRTQRTLHRKYVWSDPAAARRTSSEGAERLGPEHADEVEAFMAESYPGNFFHRRVLDARMAFGIREAGALVCFAGIHVYSAAVGVAALGNVTTAPSHRGRGLARRACAALLRALEPTAPLVGLNVEDDNVAALRCYESLGFSYVAHYEEMVLTRARLDETGPVRR
jgi:RimJ/RimL family protein N-acetyltransferase